LMLEYIIEQQLWHFVFLFCYKPHTTAGSFMNTWFSEAYMIECGKGEKDAIIW
jgi:hypothetical protein